MTNRIVILFFCASLFFSGCFLRKHKVVKEYYPSGNLKTVRKIYKNGERVKYYTDGTSHRSKTKGKK